MLVDSLKKKYMLVDDFDLALDQSSHWAYAVRVSSLVLSRPRLILKNLMP